MPFTPSTLIEKGDPAFLKRIDDILTPFLLRLEITRRAVGDPTSVKTVPKFTVSVEKESVISGFVSISSLMHELAIKPNSAMNVNNRERIFFIMNKRRRPEDIAL